MARVVVDAERGKVVHAEELQQLAAAGIGVEQPRRAPAHAVAFGDEARPAFLVRQQRFRRVNRASSASSWSSFATSLTRKRPAERSAQANPTVLAARNREQQRVAAILQQGLVGDRAGVTMRTTLRSTRPLLAAGSPICSQMATDSPKATSRAR